MPRYNDGDNAVIVNSDALTGYTGHRLCAINGGKMEDRLAQFRTNTLLSFDRWIEVDETMVIAPAQRELNAWGDIEQLGFIHDLGGIGITETKWAIQGDTSPANVAMDLETRGIEGAVDFEMDRAPVPIIYKDIQINTRLLAASRNGGEPLDVTNIAAGSRKVAIAAEDMLVKGYSGSLGGQTIYGYTNHPDRIIVTGFELTPFDISNAENMIIAMLEAGNRNQYRGSAYLYIPGGYGPSLSRRWGDGGGSSDTLGSWLEQIKLVEKVTTTDSLDPGNMLLVYMSPENIDIAKGLPLEPIEWEERGGMVNKIRVLMAAVPRLKKRRAFNGGYQVGVVHMRFQGA